MKAFILLINFLYLLHCDCRPPTNPIGGDGIPLLSRIMPNWHLRRHTKLALYIPKCYVKKKYPYDTSVNVSLYNVSRNYTAVLTGYGLDQTRLEPRPNKGVLYGWSSKVRPTITGKSSFVFYTDYAMPKPKQGNSAEFCVHIYSPPIKPNKRISKAFGRRMNHPFRNFGSDESLDRLIRSDPNNLDVKKITTCCFLTHG